ncbi:YceD family protein [Anaerovibrio sp.]|uniref:YceD family protein n=1 Tax=Anaerovibrio sp. TaxID=1872532 RepID=UPI003F136D0E
MMKINVSELSDRPGEEIPFEFTVSAGEIDAIADTYSFEGDIVVRGVYVNTGRCYRFTGQISCTRAFVCDRCLEPSSQQQVHDFCEEFQRGSEPVSGGERARIVNYFDGDVIELAPVIRDVLLSDQPLNNICNADCRGLCLKCGANLNHGDCGCDRTVIDPRLAALQQLLKKNNSSIE